MIGRTMSFARTGRGRIACKRHKARRLSWRDFGAGNVHTNKACAPPTPFSDILPRPLPASRERTWESFRFVFVVEFGSLGCEHEMSVL